MRLQKRIQDFLLLWSRIGFSATLRLKLNNLRGRFGLRSPELLELRPSGCRHSLYARRQSSDLMVFAQVFIHRQYAVVGDLDAPSLIIDCGANVGYASVYLLNRFPQARVIAVEPDPDNFQLCQRNLSPYGDRVHLVCSGVWSHPAGLVLVRPPTGAEWGVQVREAGDQERPDLSAVDLPHLIRLAGGVSVDLLKMDVEGSEGEIFQARAEQWLPAVRNIVIELHGDPCRQVFFDALRGYHFDLVEAGELTVCRDLVPPSLA